MVSTRTTVGLAGTLSTCLRPSAGGFLITQPPLESFTLHNLVSLE
jgi:hypothetical protein